MALDDEKDFDVEEDARALLRTSQIMSNPQRHEKARAQLETMMGHMKVARGLGKKMRTGKQADFERMREEKQGAKKF